MEKIHKVFKMRGRYIADRLIIDFIIIIIIIKLNIIIYNIILYLLPACLSSSGGYQNKN